MSIRLGSKYFEILKYDLQLSKNWAQRDLNSTGPERNKFRAEAKRGYESMLEQVAAAKLAPEEEAYLRLRNESRRLRRPMRDLAEAIILAEDLSRKSSDMN